MHFLSVPIYYCERIVYVEFPQCIWTSTHQYPHWYVRKVRIISSHAYLSHEWKRSRKKKKEKIVQAKKRLTWDRSAQDAVRNLHLAWISLQDANSGICLPCVYFY